MNPTTATARPDEPEPDPRMLLDVLEGIDYGLWLLGHEGQVLLANRSAMSACCRDGPFALQDGQLIVREPTFRTRFAEALADAHLGLRRLVRVAQAGARSLAAVVPHRRSADSDKPQALVLLGRRAACEPLSLEMFAHSHRLTLAETMVLAGLCEGLSPTQLAQRLSVALSTVRTQLNSIRAKTGATSLRELLLQVNALPPVMPLLSA